MQDLNRKQLIILAVIISLVASVIASMVTFQYLLRLALDKKETIIREIFQPSQKEIAERVSRQDELVVRAVEQASPSVVNIVASKDVPIIEQYFANPFESDPFFKQFFGDEGLGVPQYRQKGTQKQDVSSGTGFIISGDGLILTNKHVVADTEASYTVFLNDGKKYSARVLARDPFQDLAVVKIDKNNLSVLNLGDSSQVKIGQTVIVIGNALGEFRNTVSVGVVSGLQRNIVASGVGLGQEELQELIQTDAAINPGNSGGPILNLRGEVIGISVAMARGAENIGFAIPINKAKRDIEDVKSKGKISYPFLGVRYLVITDEVKEKNNLPAGEGAWIRGDKSSPGVVAQSPADKAGLKEGDIVLELGGEKIDKDHSLASIVSKHQVDEEVAIKILREGKEMVLKARLEERR